MLRIEDLAGLHVVDRFTEIDVPVYRRRIVGADGRRIVRSAFVRIDGVAHAFHASPPDDGSWGDYVDLPRAEGAAARPVGSLEVFISRPGDRLEYSAWPFCVDDDRILDVIQNPAIEPRVCNFVRRPQADPEEPEDVLTAICDRTGLVVLEVGVEWVDVARVGNPRLTLPMGSGMNIRPGTSAEVIGRPGVAFRPQRFVIGGTPAHWIVHDIWIGGRSQLAQGGDIPGEMFASTAVDTFVVLDAAQGTTDVAVVVTYVGPEPAGAPFLGVFIGTAVEPIAPLPPRRTQRFVARWTPAGIMRGWQRGEIGRRGLEVCAPESMPSQPAETAEPTETGR